MIPKADLVAAVEKALPILEEFRQSIVDAYSCSREDGTRYIPATEGDALRDVLAIDDALSAIAKVRR